jgi:hypothetical protein
MEMLGGRGRLKRGDETDGDAGIWVPFWKTCGVSRYPVTTIAYLTRRECKRVGSGWSGVVAAGGAKLPMGNKYPTFGGEAPWCSFGGEVGLPKDELVSHDTLGVRAMAAKEKKGYIQARYVRIARVFCYSGLMKEPGQEKYGFRNSSELCVRTTRCIWGRTMPTLKQNGVAGGTTGRRGGRKD